MTRRVSLAITPTSRSFYESATVTGPYGLVAVHRRFFAYGAKQISACRGRCMESRV